MKLWQRFSLRRLRQYCTPALLDRLIIDALIIALFFAARALLARAWYEAQGPMTNDSSIYLGVGRGILNGLLPYRDLFETKPPGIFILSALSLWLTGDHTIVAWVEAGIFIAAPIALAVFAWIQTPKSRQLEATLMAAILGCMLSLYSAEHAGEFQTESFGAAAGIAYALSIAGRKSTLSRKWQWVIALCLLGAIGFKEPFLWSCLATALVLETERPARLVHSFVMPLLYAIFIGMVIMYAWGILGDYFTIYLPSIRDYVGGKWAPFLRGLDVDEPWRELYFYNYKFAYTWCVLSVIVFWQCTWRKSAQVAIWTTVAFLLGLYLLSLSVGSGGQYYNHHHAFAVPGYAAIALLCIRAWARLPRIVHVVLILLTLWFGSGLIIHPYHDFISDHRAGIEQTKADAAAIDAILDQCHQSRYMFLGIIGLQPYAFTKHSPLGPTFFQFNLFLEANRTYFRYTFLQNIYSANVLIMHDEMELNDFRGHIAYHVTKEFSWDPPACAQGITLSKPYHIVYRKSAFPDLQKPAPQVLAKPKKK